MNCPYCKKPIQNDLLYCKECGMPLHRVEHESHQVDAYWEDVNSSVKKHNERILSAASHAVKKEKRIRRRKNVRLISICTILVAVVVTIATLILSLQKANKEKLDFIHQNAIGETFETHDGGMFLFSGDERDLITVTFTNEKSLDYIYGEYTFLLKSDNTTEWREEKIYEHESRNYEFQISFFGNVTLLVDGETYDVELHDDETLHKILFFD